MKFSIFSVVVWLAAAAPSTAQTTCMQSCRARGREIRDECRAACQSKQCRFGCRMAFDAYKASVCEGFLCPDVTWIQFPVENPPNRTDIELLDSWDHIGMDTDNGIIYMGWSYRMPDWTREFRRENVALYRYFIADDSIEYLGNYIETLQAAGNYVEGESVPKGHTHITFAGGKMYMATQGFADMKTFSSFDTLSQYRGSHLFSYDDVSGLVDLSQKFPGGVVTENDGIIALSLYPYGDYIVAQSHPNGKIILYDYVKDEIFRVADGIPKGSVPGNDDEEYGHFEPRALAVSREIVVTPSGKVYVYRGSEDFYNRDLAFNIYEYNIETDTLTMLDFTCTGGFWDGQSVSKDRRHVYISTVQGMLYHLDTETEEWSFLGDMEPVPGPLEPGNMESTYGLILSPDEKYLYYATSWSTNHTADGYLYQFDIATKEVTRKSQLGSGRYTGNNVRDSENVYLLRFGGPEWWTWNNNPGLLKIHIG